MNTSHFKILHNGMALGVAYLTNNRVVYGCDPGKHYYFESQPDGWCRDFKRVVRRLCRSVGHSSIYSISTDEDSGITVERV